MSLGFKLAGMVPVGVLDIFESGIETYRKNFPEVPRENIVRADADTDSIAEKFKRKTSIRRADIDVIIGGPPCQGFSTVGRIKIASLIKNGQRRGRSSNARFIDDKRNRLYKSFVKFVDVFRPKAFVMENVTGMVSYRDGGMIEQICEDFHRVGYRNTEYRILDAVDYGVPQSRKRVFFMATKGNSKITWPEKTHFLKGRTGGESHPSGCKSHVTVGDAIGDLPYLGIPVKNSTRTDSERKYRYRPRCEYQEWARDGLEMLHNNITRWHRQKDIDVFRHMDPGNRWSDLSSRDRKRIGYNDCSFGDKWKRLSPDRPSWTVTSHLSKDGYMYIHPFQNRTISVREAARLQSFPDRFVFCGSRSAQFTQVGNAVPPLLATCIAKHLKREITRR